MTEGFPGLVEISNLVTGGTHTLIFHEVLILLMVVIHFLYCSFHTKLWVPFSSFLGGIMKSTYW